MRCRSRILAHLAAQPGVEVVKGSSNSRTDGFSTSARVPRRRLLLAAG